MLHVWTKKNCSSSQKSKKWLLEHQVPFIEKKFGKQVLTKQEFFHILRLSENGTSDVISKHARIYQKFGSELEDIQLSHLWLLICQYPTLLRSPIIFNAKNLLVGFNMDEMRVFISKKQRKMNQYQNLLAYPFDLEMLTADYLFEGDSERGKEGF